MIRYLQLPFHFDTAILKEEVGALTLLWKPHFNKSDYEGEWTGLSLRAPGGSAENLLTESSICKQPFADTPLMDQCPRLRAMLSQIKCEKTSIRLLKLAKNAVIKEHRDLGLNFEEGEARLHIPVQTNPLVEFYLDNIRLVMEEGSCWYINASLPHRLTNPSPADRIHLVVDCMVNDWLTSVFMSKDLPVRNDKDTSKEDHDHRNKIIEVLRASNDPLRIALGDRMASEMNAASVIP